MAGFDVSSMELQSASVLLGDVGAGLRAELAALSSEIESLGSSWRGGAAAAFAGCWAEWDAGAREAVDALETMSGLLRVTDAKYLQGERDSRAAVVACGEGPR